MALGPVLTTLIGLIVTGFIYGLHYSTSAITSNFFMLQPFFIKKYFDVLLAAYRKAKGRKSDGYPLELEKNMETKPDDLDSASDVTQILDISTISFLCILSLPSFFS